MQQGQGIRTKERWQAALLLLPLFACNATEERGTPATDTDSHTASSETGSGVDATDSTGGTDPDDTTASASSGETGTSDTDSGEDPPPGQPGAPIIEEGVSVGLVVEADSTSTGALNTLRLTAVDDSETLQWAVSSEAQSGTVELGAASRSSGEANTIVYTPSGGYIGRDTFTVRVTDQDGLSATAEIRVSVASAVRWTDPESGDDANPGTSEAPWRTLNHAAAQLSEGEAVLARSGTYAEQVEPLRSGTPERPIVYFVPPGESAVLDGSGLSDASPEAFRLDEAESNIIIEGFEITGFDESIYVTTGPHRGLELRHLDVHHSGRGALLGSVEGSTVADSDFHETDEEGLNLERCADVVVARCNAWGNDDGAGVDGDADGFHSHLCDGLRFEDCHAWNNSEDGFDLTSNSTLDRCSASDNGAVGFKLWRREDDGFADKRYEFRNVLATGQGEAGLKSSEGPTVLIYASTFVDNAEEAVRIKVNEHGGEGVFTLQNSVVVGSGYQGLVVEGGYEASGAANLYFDNGGDSDLDEPDSTFGQDPRFESADDYTPASDSPLLDAGMPLDDVDVDIRGVARPQGPAFDIGAYERIDAG